MMRAPPPKMRDLMAQAEFEAPMNPYKSVGLTTCIVRQVEPEDVYDDRPRTARSNSDNSQYSYPSNTSHYSSHPSFSEESFHDPYATIRSQGYRPMAPPPPRQISGESMASTNISGSENWETYDDTSEPEVDVSDAYYARLKAARTKRFSPEQTRPASSQSKRIRGIPPQGSYNGPVMIDQDGNRIISGSEWTDEDAY